MLASTHRDSCNCILNPAGRETRFSKKRKSHLRQFRKPKVIFLSFLPGLSRCEDSFEIGLADRLPFRQLSGPLNSDDKSESRELHSVLQSSPPKGAAAAAAPHSHVVEPELLTTSQEIEVVLGDTTVLPCKVAHLGNFPSSEQKEHDWP